MKYNKKITAMLISLSLSSISFSVSALQAGDIFVRGTVTNVDPNDDATPFTNAQAVTPGVNDDTTLGGTLVYMMSDNLGFELLASLPFEHDITVSGGTVATTKQLPPTFSVQYYMSPASDFRPYVGAGINYTLFFNDNIDPNVAAALNIGTDLSLDDSIGFAVQIGFDYDLKEQWFVNVDLRYISIETTATNAILGSSDVDINPTVLSLGLGYKF